MEMEPSKLHNLNEKKKGRMIGMIELTVSLGA